MRTRAGRDGPERTGNGRCNRVEGVLGAYSIGMAIIVNSSLSGYSGPL